MLKMHACVLLAATLGALSLPIHAAQSEAGTTARQGVVRCGGNHLLRMSGSEVGFTAYAVRNFDSLGSITIDRMRMFNGQGIPLFDSLSGGLPPSENDLIGGGQNVLGPNQSTVFYSFDMVPGFLPEGARPLQLEIQWSSPRSVVSLDAITVRITSARSTTTGAILEERGRHAIDCRSILLK